MRHPGTAASSPRPGGRSGQPDAVLWHQNYLFPAEENELEPYSPNLSLSGAQPTASFRQAASPCAGAKPSLASFWGELDPRLVNPASVLRQLLVGFEPQVMGSNAMQVCWRRPSGHDGELPGHKRLPKEQNHSRSLDTGLAPRKHLSKARRGDQPRFYQAGNRISLLSTLVLPLPHSQESLGRDRGFHLGTPLMTQPTHKKLPSRRLPCTWLQEQAVFLCCGGGYWALVGRAWGSQPMA